MLEKYLWVWRQKSRTEGQSKKPSETQWMLYNMFTCWLMSWKWQENVRFDFQWDKTVFCQRDPVKGLLRAPIFVRDMCSKCIFLGPLAEGLSILGKAKCREDILSYVVPCLWALIVCPAFSRESQIWLFFRSLWLMSRTIHPSHNHVSDFLSGSQLEKKVSRWLGNTHLLFTVSLRLVKLVLPGISCGQE